MSYLYSIPHEVGRFIQGLDTQGWAIISAIAVAIGLICMRGFGSRQSF